MKKYIKAGFVVDLTVKIFLSKYDVCLKLGVLLLFVSGSGN